MRASFSGCGPVAWFLFSCFFSFFFFFNDTATTEIYTLSLHDALPISPPRQAGIRYFREGCRWAWWRDRKSTRLNSSHLVISYAVFCLKKKKTLVILDARNDPVATDPFHFAHGHLS